MAGIKSGFVTGARAKIKLGGKTMAFCTDVSYNITVQTIPVEAMGKYEVFNNEPIGYMVDGSFSIIRYTKNMAASSNITDQQADTNALGTNISGNDTTIKGLLTKGTAPDAHLNPGKILGSRTVDLEIDDKGQEGEIPIVKITDCRITRKGASLNKRGVLVDNYTFVAILADDGEGANATTLPSSM